MLPLKGASVKSCEQGPQPFPRTPTLGRASCGSTLWNPAARASTPLKNTLSVPVSTPPSVKVRAKCVQRPRKSKGTATPFQLSGKKAMFHAPTYRKVASSCGYTVIPKQSPPCRPSSYIPWLGRSPALGCGTYTQPHQVQFVCPTMKVWFTKQNDDVPLNNAAGGVEADPEKSTLLHVRSRPLPL